MKYLIIVGALAAVLSSGGLYQTQIVKKDGAFSGTTFNVAVRTNRLTGDVCHRSLDTSEPWTCDGEDEPVLCDDGSWTQHQLCKR